MKFYLAHDPGDLQGTNILAEGKQKENWQLQKKPRHGMTSFLTNCCPVLEDLIYSQIHL
jgi:hypothetical protein